MGSILNLSNVQSQFSATLYLKFKLKKCSEAKINFENR